MLGSIVLGRRGTFLLCKGAWRAWSSALILSAMFPPLFFPWGTPFWRHSSIKWGEMRSSSLAQNSSQLLEPHLARHSSQDTPLLNSSNTSTSRNTSLRIHPLLTELALFAPLALVLSHQQHPPHIMNHKRVLSDPTIEGPPSPKRPNFTNFARRTFGQRGPTITATIPPIHITESSAAPGGVGTWSTTRKQVIELATHLLLTFPEEVLDAILMIESYARHVKRTYVPSSIPQAYASVRATSDTISSSREDSSDGRAPGMEDNARVPSPRVLLCQLYPSSALAPGGL